MEEAANMRSEERGFKGILREEFSAWVGRAESPMPSCDNIPAAAGFQTWGLS